MITPGDDNAVLAVPAALTPAYDPSEIVDRVPVQSAYRDALAEMLDDVSPHLFVSGPQGTGKSLLTRQRLDEQLRADQRSVVLSCGDYDSGYAAAVALANALDPDGTQLADTGHAETAVMETLADRLASTGAAVVVLDDVDTVATEPLLPAVADATMKTAVATICVANDRSVRNELAYPIRRRLCARELRFERYSREDIRQILRQRIDTAFHEEVFSPEAIDRCVALVQSTFDGDVGQAIHLLAFVAVVADEDGTSRVTPEHVTRARDRVVSHRVQAHLADASTHRTWCLRALFECSSASDDPPRIGELYETYCELCERAGADPISERGFHDHLRALRTAELASVTSHRSGTPGHYYRYHLAVEPAVVRLALAALSETPEATE